jgi:hypothetical protein
MGPADKEEIEAMSLTLLLAFRWGRISVELKSRF